MFYIICLYMKVGCNIMGKVPEYMTKAIKKYNSKFDRITINLKKGYKEEVRKRTKISISQLINDYLEEFIKNNDVIE